MKPSKPVSFSTLSHQLFIPKFWTNNSVCLDAQFLLDTVGVAPLPSRLWFLSYPDTMNHFSSVHLFWAACYDNINLKTLNNTLIDKPGWMLYCSSRLRFVLAFILYSQASKLSSLVGFGAVTLADYSRHWFGVCSFVFRKVKVKFMASLRLLQHLRICFILHFFHQTVFAVSVRGWGCWLQNSPSLC